MTTREYVDPPSATGSLSALNPNAIAVVPSKGSVLHYSAPVSRALFEVPAVVRSMKGDISAAASVAFIRAPSTAVSSVAAVVVVNPRVGVTTLDKTFSIRMRGVVQ